MKKKVIIIISGGMDSCTLLHQVVKKHGAENVAALSFQYGSKHMGKEIPMAKFNCKKLGVKHRIIDVQSVFVNFKSALLNKKDSEEIPEGHYESSNMKKTVVPFRNGILLSIAAGFADTEDAKILYYGAHSGDHLIYPDCRKEFVDAISKAIKLGSMNKVEVKAPYWNLDKPGVLKRGLKLGVDFSRTWTCYSPLKNGKPCSHCGSCIERNFSFIQNKMRDPLYTEKEWEVARKHTYAVLDIKE